MLPSKVLTTNQIIPPIRKTSMIFDLLTVGSPLVNIHLVPNYYIGISIKSKLYDIDFSDITYLETNVLQAFLKISGYYSLAIQKTAVIDYQLGYLPVESGSINETIIDLDTCTNNDIKIFVDESGRVLGSYVPVISQINVMIEIECKLYNKNLYELQETIKI